MLIVKGESQKSVLANILMNKTNSICFSYYDSYVVFDSICVDSRTHSLKCFTEYITEELQAIHSVHYDYFIIYTNEKEEDLKELIDMLNKHNRGNFFKDVLVMCKE